VEGRYGVGEVVWFGGADDGGGDDRLGEQPGDADLGHRHPAFFSQLLDSLDNGLVDVEVEALGDVVGVTAAGALAPRSGEDGRHLTGRVLNLGEWSGQDVAPGQRSVILAGEPRRYPAYLADRYRDVPLRTDEDR
jgi:hypothetical protein